MSEDIRDKFANTDMENQIGVLQKSMYHMISFHILKTENDFLDRIAETHNHSHYDIKLEYYDHWLESLIATVKETDPLFDSEVELAWRITFSSGILYMKMHYDP